MKSNYLLVVGGIFIVLAVLMYFIKVPSPRPSPAVFTNNLTEADSSPSPSPTPFVEPKLLTLRLFFVALNDNGKNGEMIGCQDSIAPVSIQIPETKTPLQAIFQQLLSTKQQTVGPSKLYNSLYQSNLQFKDASIKNGVATIHLTGSMQLAGECDNPRFQSQLEKTALQFSDVNSVQIFINDKPLSEVVSLK